MERIELETLVRQYRPDPDTLERLGRVRLLMVVGPSGVGKSTLMKASGIPEVLGDASRRPRAGERNGIDYWFRTEANMLREIRQGSFVQIAVGAEGDIKATHASSFPEAGPAIFAVVASAVPTFRALPFARTWTAVVVPPDYGSWMQRLGGRHAAPDQLERRMEEARASYGFALADSQSQFVLNDTVGAAVARLRQVAAGEVPEGNDRARAIAGGLLARLG